MIGNHESRADFMARKAEQYTTVSVHRPVVITVNGIPVRESYCWWRFWQMVGNNINRKGATV